MDQSNAFLKIWKYNIKISKDMKDFNALINFDKTILSRLRKTTQIWTKKEQKRIEWKNVSQIQLIF